MNEDHVWEMYHSEAYQPRTVQACRDRIHWLAERARGRVLDVGCSQGLLPILLARAGHEVVGVDVEEPAIAFARDKLADEPDEVKARVRLLVKDVLAGALDEVFDTVVLGEVLEHLARPEAMLAAVAGLVADGGRVLITVPLGWLEHHDHKQAFVPSELVRLLEARFGITELDVVHDKMCVVAVPGKESAADAVDPSRLLVAVERALVELQRREAEAVPRYRAAIARLTQERAAARARGDRLAARADRLAARVQELTEQREALRQSGAYQLGSLLVGVGKRPASAVKLPRRLASLAYREFTRKRRPRGVSRRQLARQVYDGSYRVELDRARRSVDAVEHRILHLLEYSLPHKQNGYTLRSMQIVRAQKAQGWEPAVVTRPGFPDRHPPSEPDVIADVPHYRLPGRGLPDRPDLAEYLRAYVTEAAGIVEQFAPGLIQAGSNFRNAYAAMELARHYRLPFVYEVRGLWEETRVANGRLTRGDAQYRRLVDVETHCMRAAHAVVTLSESLKSELVRRGVDGDKIFLVRNAVDPGAVEVRAPRDDLRAALGLTGKFVVGYIGSVTPLENLETLVDAMRVLSRRRRDGAALDVAALIVGAGTAADDLAERARRMGVADRVCFAGAVAHADVADYYAIADAIVCTRGRHRVCEVVTPLKPYEAMAYRKPVVVSDIPALREMVEDRETGRVVPPDDPSALADVIAELADDPRRSAALGERAHAWVREHRTWQRVANGYRDAYDYARRTFRQ